MKSLSNRLWHVALAIQIAGMGGALAWAQDKPAGELNEPVILDEIVAKVNNEIVTLTDLNRALKQLHLEVSQDDKDPSETEKIYQERKRNMLKFMIQTKLMVQKAEELGITSDIDMDVSTYLEEMRKEAGIPSLEVLDQYFRQRGSSLQEYRERIKEQMITRSLLQQYVYSKITLLTSEVEAYYQAHQDDFMVPGEVHLAEILFLTEGKDKAAVHEKAEEALKRLKAGEDFTTVAKEVSEGPTASKGGDIGTFRKGSMNSALEAVVFEIPVGSFSDIVETDYGYQIVKVVERSDPTVKPLQDVRPQISERLYEKKAQPEVDSFMKTLFEESYIYVPPKYREEYDLDGLGI
jgi:peptidyl-prolyl cis-trans isomerase SurA